MIKWENINFLVNRGVLATYSTRVKLIMKLVMRLDCQIETLNQTKISFWQPASNYFLIAQALEEFEKISEAGTMGAIIRHSFSNRVRKLLISYIELSEHDLSLIMTVVSSCFG